MRKLPKVLCALSLSVVILFSGVTALALPTVYFRGDEQSSRIAITMDDCWKMDYVVQMLDLCKEYGFHMTFFPCGTNIREKELDVWQRMLDEGHEIGNHTQNHRKLTNLNGYRIRDELNIMQASLNRTLGYEHPLRLMRPPYGAFGGGNGSKTARKIEDFGYNYIIMWSLSETDPYKMLEKVKNGDILLYHTNPKDVNGLKKAIPILLERGYQLVTVSELLGLDEKETEPAV